MFKEGIAKMLKLDQVMERLTDYVESRIEILKYDLKEDLSKIVSKLSVYLIIVFAGTFFLLFLSVAVALQLALYVGYIWGFAIVGFVYVVIAIIVYSRRRPLSTKIEDEIKILIKQKKK